MDINHKPMKRKIVLLQIFGVLFLLTGAVFGYRLFANNFVIINKKQVLGEQETLTTATPTPSPIPSPTVSPTLYLTTTPVKIYPTKIPTPTETPIPTPTAKPETESIVMLGKTYQCERAGAREIRELYFKYNQVGPNMISCLMNCSGDYKQSCELRCKDTSTAEGLLYSKNLGSLIASYCTN